MCSSLAKKWNKHNTSHGANALLAPCSISFKRPTRACEKLSSGAAQKRCADVFPLWTSDHTFTTQVHRRYCLRSSITWKNFENIRWSSEISGDCRKPSEVFGRSSKNFGSIRVIFGNVRRSSENVGSIRVIFGNIQECSGDLRKSSEDFVCSSVIFGRLRTIFGRFRTIFGGLRNTSVGLRQSSF